MHHTMTTELQTICTNRKSLAGWLKLLVLLPFLGVGATTWAQCGLSCQGSTPEQPITVPVDGACHLNLEVADLLFQPGDCPGDKQITVRDSFSHILADTVNGINFPVDNYLGQRLSITIVDAATGVLCIAFVVPVDEMPPQITCTIDTISCVMDTSVAVLGYPSATDNCSLDSLLSFSYQDSYIDFGCGASDVARVARMWNVEDEAGNAASCAQFIHVRRSFLADITFPKDTALRCDADTLSWDTVWQPTLFGNPIGADNSCGWTVGFTDDTLFNGNVNYQIQRDWVVADACTDSTVFHQQVIGITDTIGPSLACPPTVTITAEQNACYGTVFLPMPTMILGCDTLATFFVNTSYGQYGLGPHFYIPIGSHTAQYTAIDGNNNTAMCSTVINIVDNESPDATSDDELHLSIPSGGYARIMAGTIDEGSTDNCATSLYYKVKRIDAGACGGVNGDDNTAEDGHQEWFDDEAWFCCEEIGNQVQIMFRAYEINPGAGPVDPAREAAGGDLHGHYAESYTMISIEDQLAPTLSCPADTVVDRTTDCSDLSIFGEAEVFDNCVYQMDTLNTEDLNDCGIGEIVRTFVATDPQGNSNSCVQRIIIEDLQPVDEGSVVWPEDVELGNCGASTDPDDLPTVSSYPVVYNIDSVNLGISYVDELFTVAFPGCYKILRHWTVVDWCIYNPSAPDAGGRFSKTQIIKVEDSELPVLTCPPSVVQAAGDDCEAAMVLLDPVTASDCNTNVLITNNSPYAISNGADASGVYPMGTTLVDFEVSDRCGNNSSCQVEIRVEDQTPPVPVCIVGLSINLSTANGEVAGVLHAGAFDGGSQDNCTVNDNLVKTLRVAGSGPIGVRPTTPSVTFDCSHLGTQLMEYWIMDEVGNTNHCVTVLAVQDNSGLCPQQASTMIAGEVTTEMGEQVDEVMIETVNGDPMQAYTGPNGFFELLGAESGGDYTLAASREDNPLNGVSTFDLILISRHILGVQRISSPYKQIAADANSSGSITTLDLIGLRKLILGIDLELPNGTPSWRFIPTDYDFPNALNAFAEDFPEELNINSLEDTYAEANFVGIKVGDIDNSASPNDLVGIDERLAQGTLELKIADRKMAAGQQVELTFSSDQLGRLLGCQLSLGFDTEALNFLALERESAVDMGEEHFNLKHAKSGWLYASWNTAESLPLGSDEVLFTLSFRAKRDISSLEDLIFVSDKVFQSEAYQDNDDVLDIALSFVPLQLTSSQLALDFEVYQNQPNPFRQETTIGFKLPQAGMAVVTVFDLAGKVAFQQEGQYEDGYNEIKVTRGDLGNSGMYYYQVKANGLSDTRKMILVK